MQYSPTTTTVVPTGVPLFKRFQLKEGAQGREAMCWEIPQREIKRNSHYFDDPSANYTISITTPGCQTEDETSSFAIPLYCWLLKPAPLARQGPFDSVRAN